jgi:hypothetical protein
MGARQDAMTDLVLLSLSVLGLRNGVIDQNTPLIG